MEKTVEKFGEYLIRKMSPKDIPQALHLWASHDFGEGKYSLSTFLQIDANGFYVAIDPRKDQVIGVCGGPFIRDDTAFIGMYAVHKEYFGQNIGKTLFSKVLSYIGDRNGCLFSVPEKIPLYRDQLGFKVDSKARLLIYHTKGKVQNEQIFQNSDTKCVKLEPILTNQLIDKIIEYDQRIHHCRREHLLRLTFKESGNLFYAAMETDSDTIVGYGGIKENCIKGIASLHPLYANSKSIAKQLIVKLVNEFEIAIKKGFIYYPIDTNEEGIQLANELGLKIAESVCDPLLYRTQVVDIDYQKIYSVFSVNFSL